MEPFKNNMSPELVACIADHLEKHLNGFVRSDFEVPVLEALAALELKQRAQLIADKLYDVLPAEIAARNHILEAMLHPVSDAQTNPQSDEDGIRGWGVYPLTMVVGQQGLSDFDSSMLLLKEMTKRFTAEFDVRYFLVADQARCFEMLSDWVTDKNHHVRRLVSEGARPRLPWGMRLPKLIEDPSPSLPLLMALRGDSEEYVRRSVANHLNDIAKDHPDLVAELAKDWMKGADKPREKLLRHACRTLIKQGHPTALDAFGIKPPQIDLKKLHIKTDVVELGSALEFSVDLASTSRQTQSVIVDYVIHFVKANGKRAGKVFKWKRIELKAGDTISMSRAHKIKPITTRRYYAGKHAIALRINGKDYGFEEFELKMP